MFQDLSAAGLDISADIPADGLGPSIAAKMAKPKLKEEMKGKDSETGQLKIHRCPGWSIANCKAH